MTAARLLLASSLAEAFEASGLPWPGDPGKKDFVRFSTHPTRRDDRSGWLRTFPDGDGAAFGCWRSGESFTWQRANGHAPTPAERKAWREKAAAASKQAEAERERDYQDAARTARAQWAESKPLPPDFAYLTRKGIEPHGARLSTDGRMMLPVHGADGEIQSLQFIAADGSKRFHPGGRIAGGWLMLGTVSPGDPVLICEGFSTGASLREATGYPVMLAFAAGNLAAVAALARSRHPKHTRLICGDDDRRTEGNPGRTKAEAAAKASAARVIFPTFKGETGTDFNDQAQESGIESVRRAVAASLGLGGSYDAADLIGMDMAEPAYLCRPWIAEGVTLLVGRPKIGKTTLVRQLMAAINTAGEFFGATCERAGVLFLSMEEGERLMRKKLRAAFTADQLRGIRLEFEWQPGEAGVEALRERLKRDSGIRLVIVDSLSRFRLPATRETPQFQQDYTAIKHLADLAKEFPGLSVTVLHHTTKATPDDPVSAISGTYGLSAAADSYLVLLLQAGRFRLHAGGRLWEGDASDFELTREGGQWSLAGTWEHDANGQTTPQQSEILAILKAEGCVTGAGLAARLGITRQGASDSLRRMAEKGLVSRDKDGWHSQ